jgi:predicted ABC-type ATPase
MLRELERHVAAWQSFAFETTLSGRGYLRQIDLWRAAAYKVKLIFLQLDTPDEAIARVAQRSGQHARSRKAHRRRICRLPR